MIAVVFFVSAIVVTVLGIELVRWWLRPEARRLRVIKKIGGRR